MHRPRGTFLLRFSDSEIGGITIAWVDDDPKTPGKDDLVYWGLNKMVDTLQMTFLNAPFWKRIFIWKILITDWSLKITHLTYCGLVMAYGGRDLGQHWLRLWLVAWWHQAITWTSVNLSSMRSCVIQLSAILQEIPGDNELTHCGLVTPYGDRDLDQVMAWCREAPSHYLNKWWLIISEVQWHSY